MRKALMIAGLILAIGALVPVGALAKAGGTDRPIKDTSSGIIVVDPATLSFTVDTAGRIAHLGRATAHLEGVVTPTGPLTFSVDGTVTAVAANGDKLFATFSGSGTNDGSGNTEGPEVTTITGGTGRFENARGTEAGSFRTTENGGFFYSQRGTISY
jgi:hypothetical protein